jgi:hypothetical protein
MLPSLHQSPPLAGAGGHWGGRPEEAWLEPPEGAIEPLEGAIEPDEAIELPFPRPPQARTATSTTVESASITRGIGILSKQEPGPSQHRRITAASWATLCH